MEQRAPILAPSLSELEEEASTLLARPGFDRAMRVFCAEMVSFHHGRGLVERGCSYTLAWASSVLIIYLDHKIPRGVTFTDLARLCRSGDLAGRKAVRNAIDALLSAGMVVERTREDDRRSKRLRPTARLLDLMQDSLVARLKALGEVVEFPAPPATIGSRRDVLLAFLSGNVEAFACSRFKLYDRFPEVRAFMDRSSGYLILLDLLQRVEEGVDGALTARVSPSDLARRFHVSRAHVRKLLRAAAEQEWLDGVGRRIQRVRLTRAFYMRLRLWIGLEFVWMRLLVGDWLKPETTTLLQPSL